MFDYSCLQTLVLTQDLKINNIPRLLENTKDATEQQGLENVFLGNADYGKDLSTRHTELCKDMLAITATVDNE